MIFDHSFTFTGIFLHKGLMLHDKKKHWLKMHVQFTFSVESEKYYFHIIIPIIFTEVSAFSDTC